MSVNGQSKVKATLCGTTALKIIVSAEEDILEHKELP